MQSPAFQQAEGQARQARLHGSQMAPDLVLAESDMQIGQLQG